MEGFSQKYRIHLFKCTLTQQLGIFSVVNGAVNANSTTGGPKKQFTIKKRYAHTMYTVVDSECGKQVLIAHIIE